MAGTKTKRQKVEERAYSGPAPVILPLSGREVRLKDIDFGEMGATADFYTVITGEIASKLTPGLSDAAAAGLLGAAMQSNKDVVHAFCASLSDLSVEEIAELKMSDRLRLLLACVELIDFDDVMAFFQIARGMAGNQTPEVSTGQQ